VSAPARSRVLPAAVLGGLGAALVARPRDVVRAVCGTPVPPAWIVRVLGARQLAQELLILAVPDRRVLYGATGTDALHAVSMIAAAFVWPQYRRAALTSAAVAAVSSVRVAALAAPAALGDHSGT
jgi:hypothetical protein